MLISKPPNQQLLPEAVEAVFHEFNASVQKLEATVQNQHYQYIAADGSTISFHSDPRFASEDYYISEGHSARGFYSMHMNAFFDLNTKTYTDALIQSAHEKDEYLAFCQLVDRHKIVAGLKCIFIGDRGYCSYNNMAHVIEKGQYFLFRTKDITSKGLVANFDFPDSDEFDISVNVTLTRSHRKSIKINEGFYRRFVDVSASFDYITYGSVDTYNLTFHIVRFKLSEDTYECIVTNLPREEFPSEKIKETYNSQWGIESSFRKLKYTIGLNYYHSYKPDFIKQEIWAKHNSYGFTETTRIWGFTRYLGIDIIREDTICEINKKRKTKTRKKELRFNKHSRTDCFGCCLVQRRTRLACWSCTMH